MLIDWFTVGAQVFNFILLVWLLKRFLYRPILDAIDAREKKIALSISTAQDAQAKASAQLKIYQDKVAGIDQQRADLLQKADQDAQAERLALIAATRKTCDELRAQSESAWKAEQLRLRETLIRRIQDEVFSVSRQTLSELAGVDIEASIVERFLQRWHALDIAQVQALRQAIAASPIPPILCSAFDMPPALRAKLAKEIQATLGSEIQLTFTVDPALINGLELRTAGQTLAWSVSNYLTSIAKSLSVLDRTQDAHVDTAAPGQRA